MRDEQFYYLIICVLYYRFDGGTHQQQYTGNKYLIMLKKGISLPLWKLLEYPQWSLQFRNGNGGHIILEPVP